MPTNPSSFPHASSPYFFLRLPEETDWPHIVRWMVLGTGLQHERRAAVEIILHQELTNPEKGTDYSSWIAIAGDKPIFFLELVGKEYLFLTTPFVLTDRPNLAFFIWRKALDHIISLAPVNGIRVTLDRDKVTEAGVLEKLGFVKVMGKDPFIRNRSGVYEYRRE